MSHHRTIKSPKQLSRSHLIQVKTIAYDVGARPATLRAWLRHRYGVQYSPWQFTAKEAREIISEYQDTRHGRRP